MKNKKLSQLKKSFIAGFATLIFSAPAFADESITDLIDYLQRVVNIAADTAANYIYQLNPSLPKTILANVSQQKADTAAQAYARGLTFCQVYNSLPRNPEGVDIDIPPELASMSKNSNNVRELCESLTQQFVTSTDSKGKIQNNTDKFKNLLFNIKASDSPGKTGVSPAKLQAETATPSNMGVGNSNFSFDNLFVPTLYTPAERKNALNFVSFAGKLYEPFPLTKTQWEQLQGGKAPSTDLIDYQTTLRSFIAAQSVGIGNLYRLIANRSEAPEVVALGLKNDQGIDIKSPLQYREYQVNRRNNADWYDMVNSAPSPVIAKESLSILAEIQRSLFRLEQTNERLLATLSIMSLQTLNSNVRPELKALGINIQNKLTSPSDSVSP